MGKIWLKSVDPNRQCCGCEGKVSPCDTCCEFFPTNQVFPSITDANQFLSTGVPAGCDLYLSNKNQFSSTYEFLYNPEGKKIGYSISTSNNFLSGQFIKWSNTASKQYDFIIESKTTFSTQNADAPFVIDCSGKTVTFSGIYPIHQSIDFGWFPTRGTFSGALSVASKVEEEPEGKVVDLIEKHIPTSNYYAIERVFSNNDAQTGKSYIEIDVQTYQAIKDATEIGTIGKQINDSFSVPGAAGAVSINLTLDTSIAGRPRVKAVWTLNFINDGFGFNCPSYGYIFDKLRFNPGIGSIQTCKGNTTRNFGTSYADLDGCNSFKVKSNFVIGETFSFVGYILYTSDPKTFFMPSICECTLPLNNETFYDLQTGYCESGNLKTPFDEKIKIDINCPTTVALPDFGFALNDNYIIKTQKEKYYYEIPNGSQEKVDVVFYDLTGVLDGNSTYGSCVDFMLKNNTTIPDKISFNKIETNLNSTTEQTIKFNKVYAYYTSGSLTKKASKC